jgi:small conductance mechanosensitive channel
MVGMVLSVTRLDDFTTWARSDLLQIVLLVTGAMLLTRFATWLGGRVTARIEARATQGDALTRSEEAKHRHAVTQVITWTALVLIYCVTAVLVLQRLGVPLTSLVAPATVVGVAVGFGAQRVVQDLLAGFFVISERQYGFGDVIRVVPTGSNVGVAGTVEEVTLRVTRLRTSNGELVIQPNGDIRQVVNLSRDWARSVIDVPVPVGTDINKVTALLREVGRKAFEDPGLHALLLDPPTVMGVESIEVDHVNMRLVARTLPGKQFDVARQLRAAIATALQAEGIIEHVQWPAPPPDPAT